MKTWKAYDRYIQTTADSRTSHGSWGFLGPTQCATGLGRLNSIAFHPSDPDIMYVGASNGGVWKTINGGAAWTNISPVIPLLAVADIKLSPSNQMYSFSSPGMAILILRKPNPMGKARFPASGSSDRQMQVPHGIPPILVLIIPV